MDRNYAMCRTVRHLLVNDGLREGCTKHEEQVTLEYIRSYINRNCFQMLPR